jgi:ectoine hydroxylase-related dioxygenase (phytanoyl-CoA dioxygenase family)
VSVEFRDCIPVAQSNSLSSIRPIVTQGEQVNWSAPSSAIELKRDEVAQFHRDGFLGPFPMTVSTDIEEIVQRLERYVFASERPTSGHRSYMRHLDSRAVYELCADKNVVGRICSLLGPDLILWSSSFWEKTNGDKEVPWHQDCHYWPLEPPLNITAWIALTPAVVENGCLEFIRGSHKRIVEHVVADGQMLFEQMAAPESINSEKSVSIPVRAGEFIIFNDRVLHRSAKHVSSKRRLALVARFTVPFVQLYQNQLPFFPGHRAIVVSGHDRIGLNHVGAPPI